MLDILFMLGAAFIVIEGLMVLFWFVYLLRKNVNMVNIAWGLSFILAALIYALLGDGYEWRKLLVLTIVSLWALGFLFHEMKHFGFGRENEQKLGWSFFQNIHNENMRALLFFIIQGFLITILSLPFALMAHNGLSFFLPIEVFGLLAWMIGVFGETVSDWQCPRCTPIGETQGETQGIKKYAYAFFEWIIWAAYAVMALASPGGELAFIAPLLMLFILMNGLRRIP